VDRALSRLGGRASEPDHSATGGHEHITDGLQFRNAAHYTFTQQDHRAKICAVVRL
jgi:hypothetical protein